MSECRRFGKAVVSFVLFSDRWSKNPEVPCWRNIREIDIVNELNREEITKKVEILKIHTAIIWKAPAWIC